MSVHLLASSGLSRVSIVLPRLARTCGRASPPCTTKRKSIALCVDSADGERVSGYDRADLAHDRIGGKPMPAKPIPEGYHTLNPHLAVDDAAQADRKSTRPNSSHSHI